MKPTLAALSAMLFVSLATASESNLCVGRYGGVDLDSYGNPTSQDRVIPVRGSWETFWRLDAKAESLSEEEAGCHKILLGERETLLDAIGVKRSPGLRTFGRFLYPERAAARSTGDAVGIVGLESAEEDGELSSELFLVLRKSAEQGRYCLDRHQYRHSPATRRIEKAGTLPDLESPQSLTRILRSLLEFTVTSDSVLLTKYPLREQNYCPDWLGEPLVGLSYPCSAAPVGTIDMLRR